MIGRLLCLLGLFALIGLGAASIAFHWRYWNPGASIALAFALGRVYETRYGRTR